MIKFLVDIVVDGVPYNAGDSVERSEIPEGSLQSLLRLGRVSEIADAPKNPKPKKPEAMPTIG